MDTIKTIHSLIETDFERSLADAAFSQLEDNDNKLRLNNFAYSLRELSRHILHRLAPDDMVKSTCWFKPTDKKNPDAITRSQRMKYAIQRGLSDEFLYAALKLNFEEQINVLKNSIDTLSKYTHINEKSFDCPESEVDKISKEVIEAFTEFAKGINECRSAIVDALEDSINEELVSKLFGEVINDIDWLASHYEIEDYTISSIKLEYFSNDFCEFEVVGSVTARLQYGSDGDMKRGDGYETWESYPFSAQLYTTLENGEIQYNLEISDFSVDTDGHWG